MVLHFVLNAIDRALSALAARSGADPKNLVDDAMTAAGRIRVALTSAGYDLDMSLDSLKEIDRFFDEQSTDGAPNPDGLLGEQLGARMFGLGSYVGEVIRRKAGGQWVGDDTDPAGEVNIAVRLDSGTLFWPVQRVMKRLQNGAEDGIWDYGRNIANERARP